MAASGGDRSFLPNFCAVQTLFGLVLAGELLAMVLSLAQISRLDDFWPVLSLQSVLIQWVCLLSAAVLCGLRGWLERCSVAWISAASLSVVAAISAMTAALMWWGNQHWQLGLGLSSAADFVVRVTLVASLCSAVLMRYLYFQYIARITVETEAQARIEALQARIRPHFLFNSMNTIASLTQSDPVLAERVVVDLSELFRASLSDSRARVRFREELEVAQRYLAIEALRLGKRLVVRWQLASIPGDALVPPLMLQPLLENAIYHGVEPAPQGGAVDIVGDLVEQQIELIIRNTCPIDGAAMARRGHHLALDNVAQRLAIWFGERGGLAVAQEAGGYTVRLWFPYQVTEDA